MEISKILKHSSLAQWKTVKNSDINLDMRWKRLLFSTFYELLPSNSEQSWILKWLWLHSKTFCNFDKTNAILTITFVPTDFPLIEEIINFMKMFFMFIHPTASHQENSTKNVGTITPEGKMTLTLRRNDRKMPKFTFK